MHPCNRRSFLTQCLAGTALVVVARAGAAASAAVPAAGAAVTCGDCRYYRAKQGESSGACLLSDGKQVAEDSGCGDFEGNTR